MRVELLHLPKSAYRPAMEWTFERYVLNADRAELIGPDGPVHIERSPLNLLVHLIRHQDRVVSRDELIDAVWGGRIVSDATVSTAVKQARRAVGDTGNTQSVIRTVHGRGFRFIAAASSADAPRRPAEPAPRVEEPRALRQVIGTEQPSLAVLRFLTLGEQPLTETLATAIPAELISSMSRIGWLHVIARASSFRFDPADTTPDQVGAQLSVRYAVTGLIEIIGNDVTLSVDIASTEDGALIRSDRFCAKLDEIQLARQTIVASVVTALELAIPQYEAAGSRRLDENEFDAWSHFHLGLSHIYKFSEGDNLIAAQHFRAAIARDPAFARAHAGLSFTHWQNSFMHFGENRAELLGKAIASATNALDIAPDDPFANFNMGRARWLEGDLDGGRAWLDRALTINPNYAQCHYNKGLLLALDGSTAEARQAADRAMSLSPLDPLYYAMLSVRAFTHLSHDEFEEAGRLAERAMQSPGAHFYIALIAAASDELRGSTASARRWRDHAMAQRPNASIDMFFAAFPFRAEDLKAKLRGAFQRLDLT